MYGTFNLLSMPCTLGSASYTILKGPSIKLISRFDVVDLLVYFFIGLLEVHLDPEHLVHVHQQPHQHGQHPQLRFPEADLPLERVHQDLQDIRYRDRHLDLLVLPIVTIFGSII